MPGTNLNNLDAYNEVEAALGGTGAQPNDIVAVRAIAVLEGVSGGPASILDDNMVLRLNAIDVGAGGPGTHENTLDALNSIVVLKGGVGGHENDLDAINEWVDFVFTGPFDDLPASAGAWSFSRRLLSSYSGPLIRLRRASDSAEMDFGFDANGDLDRPAVDIFLAATTGFLTTIYDQTETNDWPQATAAAQPLYNASGSNDRPFGSSDGIDDFMEIASGVLDLTGNYTTSQVVNNVSGNARFYSQGNIGDGVPQINLSRVGGNLRIFARDDAGNDASASEAASDGDWHVHTVHRNATVFTTRVDGDNETTDTDTLGATTITQSTLFAFHGNTFTFDTSQISELVVWASKLSADDIDTVEAAMGDYYDITIT